MKPVAFAAGLLVAAAAFSSRAEAQNYPWCEYLDAGGDGGGTNCGFVSFQQCMESAWGNGGDCQLNTQYIPPPGPHGPPATAPAPSHRHHLAKKSHNNF
jgi:hypothetical protein